MTTTLAPTVVSPSGDATDKVTPIHRNLTLVNKDGTVSSNSISSSNNITYTPYKPKMVDLSDTTLDRLDDDRGGVALNARSRVLLMAKLQRGDEFGQTSSQILKQVAPQMSNPLDVPIAHVQKGVISSSTVSNSNTPCIVLKNVFDPKEETGTEWIKEIEEDIVSECKKFGNVLHSSLEPNSAGYVYLRFEAIDHARLAIKALNGRWFNNKRIVAEPFPFAQYSQKFSSN